MLGDVGLRINCCHQASEALFPSPSDQGFDQNPMRKVPYRPNTLGCLTNRLIKFSKFDIEYLLSSTLNGWTMADFISKFLDFLEEVPINPKF